MKFSPHLAYKPALTFSFILSVTAPTASLYAYPDLIRKGYTSCSTCHVSPSGGGALTSYGRGFSGELSTFTYEGAGAFAGVPFLETWRDPTGLFTAMAGDLQVDWRSVNFRADVPGLEPIVEAIPMQLSAEAVIHLGKTTDLVGGYGQYGKDGSLESRVHYLQVRTSKYLQFRAGRFLANYGLNLDDHTAFTRSTTGFAQGGESVNLEAHFESESATVTLTRILGRELNIVENNKQWTFASWEKEAFAARSTLKFGPRHYVGVNAYQDHGMSMVGGFAGSSPIKDWLYFLVELDQITTDTLAQRLFFLRIGSEFFRGMVLDIDTSIRQQESETTSRYAASLQLMPIPHTEFRLEGRVEGEVRTILLMSHLWL